MTREEPEAENARLQEENEQLSAANTVLVGKAGKYAKAMNEAVRLREENARLSVAVHDAVNKLLAGGCLRPGVDAPDAAEAECRARKPPRRWCSACKALEILLDAQLGPASDNAAAPTPAPGAGEQEAAAQGHPYLPEPMHDSGECFQPTQQGRCRLRRGEHA